MAILTITAGTMGGIYSVLGLLINLSAAPQAWAFYLIQTVSAIIIGAVLWVFVDIADAVAPEKRTQAAAITPVEKQKAA
ncbi:MAG TPA: hypothetical protein VL155_10760 [Terriglobales bacterium]|jgi:hypothetical protein|nr:hypothetical protein [Terriglobales bacterium]